MPSRYIHGTDADEQNRLALLNRNTNAVFLDYLSPPGSVRILEVGSGLGILASEVAKTASDSLVIGLEFSPDQLAMAARTAPNLLYVRGDAHHLPFAYSGFGLVYCRYLLEHVADPVGVLREMRRVLVPGGRVRVQENNIQDLHFDPPCPAFDHVWQRFIELQTRLGGDARVGVRLFRLLKTAGFSHVELSISPEVHWSGCAGFEWWVENVIGNIASAREKLIESGLITTVQYEAAVEELRALKERDDASAIFYWNRGTGLK